MPLHYPLYTCPFITHYHPPPPQYQVTNPRDRTALATLLEPAQQLAEDHLQGPEGYRRRAVYRIIESYLDIEERFCAPAHGESVTEQEIIDALRKQHTNCLTKVLDIVLSHQGLGGKNELIMRIMRRVVLHQPDAYRPLLRRCAALRGE